jgi:hypothetical protein
VNVPLKKFEPYAVEYDFDSYVGDTLSFVINRSNKGFKTICAMLNRYAKSCGLEAKQTESSILLDYINFQPSDSISELLTTKTILNITTQLTQPIALKLSFSIKDNSTINVDDLFGGNIITTLMDGKKKKSYIIRDIDKYTLDIIKLFGYNYNLCYVISEKFISKSICSFIRKL